MTKNRHWLRISVEAVVRKVSGKSPGGHQHMWALAWRIRQSLVDAGENLGGGSAAGPCKRGSRRRKPSAERVSKTRTENVYWIQQEKDHGGLEGEQLCGKVGAEASRIELSHR